jgi:hypothetical protein
MADGRTNQLRLEWSFIGNSTPTTLHVDPRWERKEIGFTYETTLESSSNFMPIEIVIPGGWGWSQLDIQGPNLRSFKSTDVEGWQTTTHHQPEKEEEEEESLSTIRNIIPPTLRPNIVRSSSLMKQSLPDDSRIDEFSFENQDDSGSRTVMPTFPQERVVKVPDTPTPAKLFDLIFDDEGERSFVVEGILVPLFPTLVSGSVPVGIPFVRGGECQITCPNSSLVNTEIDTSATSIGQFTWVDIYGSPIPSSTIPIKGDIRVRLMKDTWGSVRMSILFPCPRGEVAFDLGKGKVQLRKAEVDGQPVRYCQTGAGENEIRLGSETHGMAEVGLDLGERDISLPHFEGAVGTMIVELRGAGWESKSPSNPIFQTDLQSSQPYLASDPTQHPLKHGLPHSRLPPSP